MVDRVRFELSDGDLFVTSPDSGRTHVHLSRDDAIKAKRALPVFGTPLAVVLTDWMPDNPRNLYCVDQLGNVVWQRGGPDDDPWGDPFVDCYLTARGLVIATSVGGYRCTIEPRTGELIGSDFVK